MSKSLIPSFLVSDVSESLRSLTKNERPWAIRSGRSEEMSDHEQITQVAHQKWAKEWIAHFFKRIANSLIFGQKTSDLLGKPMSEFPALPKMLQHLNCLKEFLRVWRSDCCKNWLQVCVELWKKFVVVGGQYIYIYNLQYILFIV